MAEHEPDEREISLTLHRTLDAPVEAVYAAWTDPETMRRWFAPGDLAVARAVAEVEVGGTFLIEMRGQNGESHVTRGVYREVVPNRRLVHTWQWEGSDVESLVTVELEPALPRHDAPHPHALEVRAGRGTRPAREGLDRLPREARSPVCRLMRPRRRPSVPTTLSGEFP